MRDIAYIALGSNLGDRDAHLRFARSAIAELPDTQREVLLLAHYEQLSLAEIAEITQLEITAVKSRLQRARAALREILAAYAPERSELNERR